jgi:hypothetical protein
VIHRVITSPTAARVLEFLERAGPAPYDALSVALGLRPYKLLKALRHLRGAGAAYPVRLAVRGEAVEFWRPRDSPRFDPARAEAIAWFAVRLEEAGGRYEQGTALFPSGQKLPVGLDACPSGIAVVVNGDKPGRCLAWCFLKELKLRRLEKCLRS